LYSVFRIHSAHLLCLPPTTCGFRCTSAHHFRPLVRFRRNQGCFDSPYHPLQVDSVGLPLKQQKSRSKQSPA
jgi:hypothetical protein